MVSKPVRRWDRRQMSSVLYSSLGLLDAEAPNVENHDGDDRHQQQHRQRASHTKVGEVEELLVELHSNNIRSEVSASHDIHDVEDFENIDEHRRRHHRNGGANHRHGDAKENGEFARAVNARSLQNLSWNALERRRKDDHAETRPHPDVGDHEQDIVQYIILGVSGKALGLSTKGGPDGVQYADLRLAWRCVSIDKAPDDGSSSHGERHRNEDG